ncbi:MAG: hypothetical protein MJ102_03595 [Clostridia bacterium]|nr:hypothetical protein [Clostridia bacterium]
MIYKDGEVFRTEIPEETFDHVADLADSCGVTEWNGFHGCNHDVCDGDGFSFSASYSDGNRVNASGSNCWPDNYGTFNHEMRDLFDSYRKQYNYDRLPKTIESDELDYIMINFCQQGTSGHSKFEFNFSRAASYGNNLNAFVFDCNGEFGKEMQRESEQIKAASTIESPDFTGIQSVIRKYDLPSLNGYDKAAEDYLNSEWFQFHFGYSDGEYIDLMGTDPPDNYDAIRHDLITACLAIIENMDILKKNN